MVRVVAQVDVGKRVDKLYADEIGIRIVGIPAVRELLYGVCITHPYPFLELQGLHSLDGFVVEQRIVTEIADVFQGDTIPFHPLASFARSSRKLKRIILIESTHGCIQTCLMVFWKTCLRDCMHLDSQPRIDFLQPSLYISIIQKMDRKFGVRCHALCKFFRRIGCKMLSCVESDVEVSDEFVFLHRNIFIIQRTLYFVQVPTFTRISNKQSAAYLVQRVRHIVGDGDTSLLFVH